MVKRLLAIANPVMQRRRRGRRRGEPTNLRARQAGPVEQDRIVPDRHDRGIVGVRPDRSAVDRQATGLFLGEY